VHAEPAAGSLADEAPDSVSRVHAAAAAGRAFEVQALLERGVATTAAVTSPRRLTPLAGGAAPRPRPRGAPPPHPRGPPARAVNVPHAPTPVHLAVLNGHADAVAPFLAAGVSPDALAGYARTPSLLALALQAPPGRRLRVVEALLRAGADPRAAGVRDAAARAASAAASAAEGGGAGEAAAIAALLSCATPPPPP